MFTSLSFTKGHGYGLSLSLSRSMPKYGTHWKGDNRCLHSENRLRLNSLNLPQTPLTAHQVQYNYSHLFAYSCTIQGKGRACFAWTKVCTGVVINKTWRELEWRHKMGLETRSQCTNFHANELQGDTNRLLIRMHLLTNLSHHLSTQFLPQMPPIHTHLRSNQSPIFTNSHNSSHKSVTHSLKNTSPVHTNPHTTLSPIHSLTDMSPVHTNPHKNLPPIYWQI